MLKREEIARAALEIAVIEDFGLARAVERFPGRGRRQYDQFSWGSVMTRGGCHEGAGPWGVS